MSTEAVSPGIVTRFINFVRDARQEMEKVTWPERPQVVQLSAYVVGFSMFVGLVIALMDLALQGVLVKLIPSLFGR